MKAAELFQQGQLPEAIAAATEAVKSSPNDMAARYLLCELLCFDGNVERADKQLEALGQLNPKSAVSVSQFRQLLRAEKARQQFYTEGRVPEFIGEVSEETKLRLEASIAIRAGELAAAEDLLRRALEMRKLLNGTCDGKAFDEFVDIDDLLGTILEVLTSTGKYFWIPLERIISLQFRPYETPRDLIWRSAQLQVEGGPDGEVHVPALYTGSAQAEDVRLKLGRMTTWQGGEGSSVRGLGQRTFLVGDQALPILEIESVEFTPTNE